MTLTVLGANVKFWIFKHNKTTDIKYDTIDLNENAYNLNKYFEGQ